MDFKFIRDTNANSNCRNYAYCNTNCNSNSHCDADTYTYTYAYGNSYRYSYSNSNSNCNGYGNRSCDGDTNSYYKTFSYAKIEAGTKAPADPASAAIAGVTRLRISC